MRSARFAAPVVALTLTSLVACYSPTIKPPKAEEDPFAGTESDPPSAPRSNDAPPPAEQDEPNMDAINSSADRLTGDAEKNCNNAQYPGPREIATVEIVFLPIGRVEEVKVTPPHAGTAIGNCLVQTFKSAIVPPFKAEPVTVERKVDFTKKKEPAKAEPEKK